MNNICRAVRDWICDGTAEDVIDWYCALPAKAAAANYGELEDNLVVLDTEATGLSFNHDELTQIAAARIEKGEVVARFVTFVNPGKPIPEDISHMTNIYDEDVADAPSPQEALASLVEFVGDATVVAHNVEFDRSFTTKHASGYPLLENVWIDSLDLARIALPRMKSHRLTDLVKAFDAPSVTHRADDDVEATCALIRILYAAVESMPPALVSKIASMATVEEWSTVKVFKHFAEKNPANGFSLRALRNDRVASFEGLTRVDADEVAADPQRSLVFPTEDEIDHAFTREGIVGSLYSEFEPRAEQVEMAREIRGAFASSCNLMVEAGTGVGKSMAYLVPAVLAAQRNNITVGVATKTNSLLDQLVYHELPALDKALGGVTFASLKGTAHYPCLHRIAALCKDKAGKRVVAGKEYSQAPALAALLSFIAQSEYDDIDGLKIDYRTLPRWMITTTSQDCLKRKCPFFGAPCFVHGARRRAESVDVLVTNHSMLFCDMAADGMVLPSIRYWIVDEAHGAEDEARKAFSIKLSSEELVRLAQRLASDDAQKNVFAKAERHVVKPSGEAGTLFYALTAKARSAGQDVFDAVSAFVPRVKDLLYFEPGSKGKGYEQFDLWLNDDIRATSRFEGVASLGKNLSSAAEKLVTACQELVGYLEDCENAAEVQREIASLAVALKEAIRAVDVILVKTPEQYAYSATLNRKKDRLVDAMEAFPIYVGPALEERFYSRTHSVVFASATMTVGGSFSSFESALGLNETEFSRCASRQLGSSYDFDSQMTIYVASDMPEPNDPAYLAALQKFLAELHVAQHGSMLTLFTNRKEMESCFAAVQPVLVENDLRLVCQKWGVSVKGLRDDFRADEHLSLFALKSFWEGFDAPGSTLKGVIIPKLPFSKPTDPLSCERAARDDQAWRRHVLPAAVLETKQAAGRLIRKADDTGVLVLADRRLISKAYGKTFLNSMPSKTIKIDTMDGIVSAIRQNTNR